MTFKVSDESDNNCISLIAGNPLLLLQRVISMVLLLIAYRPGSQVYDELKSLIQVPKTRSGQL